MPVPAPGPGVRSLLPLPVLSFPAWPRFPFLESRAAGALAMAGTGLLSWEPLQGGWRGSLQEPFRSEESTPEPGAPARRDLRE